MVKMIKMVKMINKWMEKRRLSLLNNKNLIFSTNIGRTAEYYSGTVFEIITKNNNLNLASGGRYDSLMQVLGAKKSIPAIGGAINYNNI